MQLCRFDSHVLYQSHRTAICRKISEVVQVLIKTMWHDTAFGTLKGMLSNNRNCLQRGLKTHKGQLHLHQSWNRPQAVHEAKQLEVVVVVVVVLVNVVVVVLGCEQCIGQYMSQ